MEMPLTLFDMGLTRNNSCPYCKTAIETLEHAFIECPFVVKFWEDIEQCLKGTEDQHFVWQKSLLFDKCNFVYNKSNFVYDKSIFVYDQITFVRQKLILSDKSNFVYDKNCFCQQK